MAAHGGRPAQAEERPELAEVAPGAELGEHLLAATGELTHDIDVALFEDVHEIARVTLAEEDLTVGQRAMRLDRIRFDMAGGEGDDTVGEWKEALVVRGDDHDSIGRGEFAEQPKDPLDLDVVEM